LLGQLSAGRKPRRAGGPLAAVYPAESALSRYMKERGDRRGPKGPRTKLGAVNEAFYRGRRTRGFGTAGPRRGDTRGAKKRLLGRFSAAAGATVKWGGIIFLSTGRSMGTR